MRAFAFFVFLLSSFAVVGQYHFSGELSKENSGSWVYLSLVEDYRKSSRVYLEQIIRKVAVDSLGQFSFEGNNLLDDNRIYRIHLDGCSENANAQHFLGHCNSSQSVLFIANNRDTLHFPTSFGNQTLCTVNSTNPKSVLILDIEALKEEMVFDFMEFRSEANQKLNSAKWFGKLQDFGQSAEEPLAELYIYDFLSDKRNETYNHYLLDVSENNYYANLLTRLKSRYPNTGFTKQYEAEIVSDQHLVSFRNGDAWSWKWVLTGLLAFSIGLNIYLVFRSQSKTKKQKRQLLQKLTSQEQKIVKYILNDRSNKEIAAEMFVSLSTIKTHINNLYKKLDVSSRQEVVARFKK
ncbi:response regulator transcription factor [Flagellimonas sp.]|uniref:response regulator transcription factor n=1 Tax=Flagellimonas sp. TaxID=2058762 RepID=UPI003B52A3D8